MSYQDQLEDVSRAAAMADKREEDGRLGKLYDAGRWAKFYHEFVLVRNWFDTNAPMLEQLMDEAGLTDGLHVPRSCHYCQNSAAVIGNDASGHRVHCETANCAVGPMRTDKVAAIRAWNGEGQG